MPVIAALFIGVLFGCGILLSGMSNPAKVVNFFDVAGAWDPSLAFVMGGGLLVNVIGYRLAFRRKAPLLMPSFSLPALTRVDAALVGGSAIFGIGWGITGVCPGGLVPVLGIGRSEPLLFLAGLLLGIVAARQARALAAR
jgi:uncharacterized membrane protein YedE/YeeE